MLIDNVRLVTFRSRPALARARAAGELAAPPPQDPQVTRVRVVGGRVVQLDPELESAPGEEVLDAAGAWLLPGLWDAHAHLDLEAARTARLDTQATRSAEEALALVAAARAALPGGQAQTIQGFGHRLANWPRVPTVAELDAVVGDVPTVLISGDAHSGWVSSAALRLLGLPGASASDPGRPLQEDVWFKALERLDVIPGSAALRESGYLPTIDALLAKGVTGVVDMSWGAHPTDWPQRADRHPDQPWPRLRVAVYREQFPQWVAEGLRAGQALPGAPVGGDGQPLFTQGPLKVIADGSMGTASAHLCAPYPASLQVPHPHGVANISRADLTELLVAACAADFEVAIHAIGDAAMNDVAAAFTASGAAGRLEHAQLLPADALAPTGALTQLVRAGVELSVQPAHLLDDYLAVDRVWPGRKERTYAFADMAAAGGLLQFGSDAPVAPLDPWLALATAVTRQTPAGHVWSPSQRLTAEEALAASIDGQEAVGVGSRGDLVLVATNPLTCPADELAEIRPLATLVAGRVAWRDL